VKKIDLFIFDFDGTLIDTTQDIAASVNATLAQLGEPQLTEEEIQSNVGDGVLKLLKRCLMASHQDRIEEAVRLFRDHYGSHLVVHTVLYPGVREILEHFSSKKMAILTNKPERYIAPILERLGIQERFECAIGGDGSSVPKPSREPVREILKHCGVDEGRVVMVGDSRVDVETGKLGDVLTCAFTGGYRSREELEEARPDYIIDRMDQLKDLFD
jgi:phosphoglycolate phosphatase